MAELRKLAALVLVRMPFVGSEADFAAMVLASLREVENEMRRKQRRARRRAQDRAHEEEERSLWNLDKQLSPAPIREAITAVGY